MVSWQMNVVSLGLTNGAYIPLILGRTPYYIVAPSPWPFSVSLSSWGMAFGFVI